MGGRCLDLGAGCRGRAKYTYGQTTRADCFPTSGSTRNLGDVQFLRCTRQPTAPTWSQMAVCRLAPINIHSHKLMPIAYHCLLAGVWCHTKCEQCPVPCDLSTCDGSQRRGQTRHWRPELLSQPVPKPGTIYPNPHSPVNPPDKVSFLEPGWVISRKHVAPKTKQRC